MRLAAPGAGTLTRLKSLSRSLAKAALACLAGAPKHVKAVSRRCFGQLRNVKLNVRGVDLLDPLEYFHEVAATVARALVVYAEGCVRVVVEL